MARIPNLIVDEYGSFIAKKSGRLIVTCKKEKRQEAPLMHLETVLITGKGVSLSSDVVMACAEEGIPLHFLDSRGNPVGSFYSAGLAATVATRRAQLQAKDTRAGLAFAFSVVEGKVRNQVNLLKYMNKNRKEKQPELYKSVSALAEDVHGHLAELDPLRTNSVIQTVDACRGQLLSIEGRAAKAYWQAIGKLLRVEVGWPGRRTQGATDPFNSALNYGYGILYSQVERASVLAGLDPYAGFVHVDRPGKPSLVLDLVEEFRQTVVDRTVMAVLNRGTSIDMDERNKLTEETRRSLAEKVFARLNAAEPYEGKRHPLKSIIQMQARHLATFLRDERDEYTPFVSSW
ncbi:MAG: CRISPR-associated endonuclease Cas1 [Chloroflexota bacterium]